MRVWVEVHQKEGVSAIEEEPKVLPLILRRREQMVIVQSKASWVIKLDALIRLVLELLCSPIG
jgi:hypothetical protein